MKVVIFGASGMVGQGVLRECLLDPEVKQVVSVVRSASGQTDTKLHEVVHSDFMDFSGIESELSGCDACFFCLGVSSAGMTEAEYTRVTYAITMAAAQTLVRVSPALTFEYISGQGTASSEKGRSMWARVKGRTENALLALPFKAYMLRPGFIQPAARDQVEDAGLSVLLCCEQTAAAGAEGGLSAIRNNDRTARPGDDCGSPARVFEEGAGDERYQQRCGMSPSTATGSVQRRGG